MSPHSSPTVLLVDAYNIIGIWSTLKRIRDRDGMEAARRDLVETLINYSTYRGYDTRVVFDSHYQDTPSSREVVNRHLSIHYTDFGQTADTYIEKTCALIRQQLLRTRPRLLVATSDRAQQLTVVGYGAEWLSAQQLSFDVEFATSHRRKQQSHQKNTRTTLMSSLDPAAQQRLTQLRMGHRP